jgi:hypothetical protein
VRANLFLLALLASTLACVGPEDDDEDADEVLEDALVGGARDLRWAAAGHLLRGPSIDRLDRSRPACGATLIAPNVVVTAAHCVVDPDLTFAFGAGDVGSGPVVRVVSRHPHPKFQPEARRKIDLAHTLRLFDLATLVLERPVDFAEPAELPDGKPAMGCNVQAIGYRAEAGGPSVRKSTTACVLLRFGVAGDSIFEVRPTGRSALCHADGDEGSPVVLRDPSRQVLVGIYVGSLTQGLTDCRRSTQFLNGYESAYGFRDFLREGIARGSAAAAAP